jgi:hypothetical protein
MREGIHGVVKCEELHGNIRGKHQSIKTAQRTDRGLSPENCHPHVTQGLSPHSPLCYLSIQNWRSSCEGWPPLCPLLPQEYEERLARLKADYEAEQESRVRLQEDITAMRNSYDVKLSTLQENLRKEKETGALCPGATWEPTSCFPYRWVKGPCMVGSGLSHLYNNPARQIPRLPSTCR